MLTVSNPGMSQTLVDCPGGLLPLRNVNTGRMILMVKSMREVAVTARLRRFLRFYFVPLRAGDRATYGLVTAFFDDRDEPLTIRTPLFDEEFTHDLLEVLSSDSFDMHFFDENNRELLGCRAESVNATRLRSMAAGIGFVPGNLELARQFHDDMTTSFGTRSAVDDKEAFTVRLIEEFFSDANLGVHIQNPGESNECDIATALRPSFGSGEVYRNPARADNGREFVDVLVYSENSMLLIQAKDSPASEASLNRSLARKRSVAAAHIRKAASQLRGSIGYLRSEESVEVVANGQRRDVTMSGRDVFGLVIVKELFDPDRSECSPVVFAICEESGVPCLLLDYVEFQQLTLFRRTEEGLMGTLSEICAAAGQYGVFPRSRFGLRTDGPVVYSPGPAAAGGDSAASELASAVAAQNDGTIAAVRGNGRIGEATVAGFGEGAGDDWLGVVVDRTDVESGNVSPAVKRLSRVLADRETVERFRGRVYVAFYGYSNDPRELYEIPEVRRFCARLDEQFPYWFYFLSADGETLRVIASCLCSVAQVKPGVVSFGEDLLDFMTRHFEALNWLVDNYALDEEQNIEVSARVSEYFGVSGRT